MSQYLSIDNLIGVQPTTTSSTNLQAQQIDIYNGSTNFHRLTSNSASPLLNITIPNASGTITLNTATQTVTNKMLHGQNGSATDPSVSFINSTNMGLFRVSDGVIGITTSGVKRASISDTLITSLIPVRSTTFQATSDNWPECAFTNSTNTQTGLYFGTPTTCGVSCNGNTKMTFGSSSNTSFQQLTLPDGLFNSLSLNFNSGNTTGLYYAGANRLGIVAGNFPSATISSSQFLINSALLTVQNGTIAQPSLNFTGETTSGWCRNASGDLRCCISGASALGVQSNGIFLYGSTSGNNTNYTASKLGYYQEETLSNFTWTFGTATQVSTAQITRIGRLVTFTIDGDVTKTPDAAIYGFSSTSAIPVQYRPTSLRKVGFPAMVGIGGVFKNEYFCQINTDGTFQFTNVNYTTSSSSHTLYSFSWSWHIAP